MVDFVTGLRCRECARAFPAEALHVCDYCFGPLEVAYDYERIAATVSRERIAGGPADDLALPGPAPGERRRTGRSRCRLHPPGAGRPPGGRARPGRAVDQRTTRPIPRGPSRTGWSRSP